MTRTHTWKTVVIVLALLVAACGGTAGETDDAGNGSGNQDQGSSDGGDPGSGDFEVPEIDPSSMPPAGEAHVEVNGQSFVFRQADMLEGPFTCVIEDNVVTINFQSDRHDLLLQGVVTPENKLILNGTVAPEQGDLIYSTTNAGGAGAAAAEAPYVLYVGRFDSNEKGNPGQFDDVGAGTIAVTCP